MTAQYLGIRSLRGLWVGDCIGNSCQLYNIHDVLKALKGKLGDVRAWIPCTSQFKYSDDIMEKGGKGEGLRTESLKNYAAEIYNKVGINEDIGVPEVELVVSPTPIVGRMRQLIGNFTIDRDEFWRLTDAERQALYDKHLPGMRAPKFDPRFAEKYGKNPNGPF